MAEKVVVGMSGGVDSAVAAYLLKKQGYEVEGLFMRNWDATLNHDIMGNPTLNEYICPQEQDYNDALKTCEILGIKLHRVDFIKEYWDHVFSYFLEELKKGRTPNPDLLCNKYIKFDVFKKEALKLGAKYMATGHYAQMENGRLLRGVDSNKDQTYFLAQVSKEQLENVLFPVGDLTKPEVREIALQQGINVASKKDSTGICFIGERHYQEFISNYLKPNPGDIVNVETKEIIGRHTGLMNYTIGQRKNVGLSGFPEKHYVCGKNVEKNILYVAFGEDNKYLMSDACDLEDINWISDKRPKHCTAKFRYRAQDYEIDIDYIDENHLNVCYPCQVKAVTPGQFCVFYDHEECLGSGVITNIYKDGEQLWYI
ncbi:MAG: tRNA 2-thiouridine(34) synthase MnmA [Bacilli bacterium]|nr:tRNA 2-thiouridine(34) synthase MnmA [Bacilli bacterium]